MKLKLASVVFAFLLLPLALPMGCGGGDSDNGTPDDFISACVNDISAANLEANAQWLQGYGTRFFLAPNHGDIAIAIRNKFIQLGFAESDVRIEAFEIDEPEWDGLSIAPPPATTQYNVVARLTGSEQPGNVYVAGAHYDSVVDDGDPLGWAPGANDNASGVAGTLEIARVMKQRGFTPKSTIEFVAFASEEYDFDGSAAYIENAVQNGYNIVFMLNNDMISYEAENTPSQWEVNVMDYANSQGLRSRFVECGELYTDLTFTHDNEYNDAGDSYSFSEEGYAALFIISNDEESDPVTHAEYYHTADDVLAHYNYAYCKQVTAASCAFLIQETR